tara:strand:- start:192 stop:428 length:237 start_codon:yes stop_codon:yes gene_type:complete
VAKLAAVVLDIVKHRHCKLGFVAEVPLAVVEASKMGLVKPLVGQSLGILERYFQTLGLPKIRSFKLAFRSHHLSSLLV